MGHPTLAPPPTVEEGFLIGRNALTLPRFRGEGGGAGRGRGRGRRYTGVVAKADLSAPAASATACFALSTISDMPKKPWIMPS